MTCVLTSHACLSGSMLQLVLRTSQIVYNSTLCHGPVCIAFPRQTFASRAGDSSLPMSKLLEVKDFGPSGFKWLTLKRIYYQDPKGRKRTWESASRTTRKSECDAVAIIAKVRSKTEPVKVILEAQYRPSQDAIVVELPAGLIDDGEDAAKAAVRELKEETGYVGTVTAVSDPCFSDPGMTDSNMQWAVVDVDADAYENAQVNPQLEEGEFIEVFLTPFQGLHKTLVDLRKEKGWELDARLLGYAWALQHSQDWGIVPN